MQKLNYNSDSHTKTTLILMMVAVVMIVEVVMMVAVVLMVACSDKDGCIGSSDNCIHAPSLSKLLNSVYPYISS